MFMYICPCGMRANCILVGRHSQPSITLVKDIRSPNNILILYPAKYMLIFRHRQPCDFRLVFKQKKLRVGLIQKSEGIVWRRGRQCLRPTHLAQPTEAAAVFGCLQQTVSQSVCRERETRTISCVTKVVDVTTIYSHLKRSLSYSYTFCTQCEFSIVRAHSLTETTWHVVCHRQQYLYYCQPLVSVYTNQLSLNNFSQQIP